jgi:hypothetical protein
VVGLAGELESGRRLACESDLGGLRLDYDGDPGDFPVRVHELDLAVDREVAPGVVPHVADVGDGLVDGCLAPIASPLLNSALRHPITAPTTAQACAPQPGCVW